jgi:hypothetical protein
MYCASIFCTKRGVSTGLKTSVPVAVLLFGLVPDEASDQLTIKLIGSDKQLLGSDGFVVFGFLPLEFLFLFIPMIV